MIGQYAVYHCMLLALFTPFVMQHLPAMLPGAVIMAPVSHVASEFQSYYNTLTLEPQDVLRFACQIASGMVSPQRPPQVLGTLSQVSSPSPGVLGQPEHHPQRPCLQEHLACPQQSAEAS